MSDDTIRAEERIRLRKQQISEWEKFIKELESYVDGWVSKGISVVMVNGLSAIAYKISAYDQMIWQNRRDNEFDEQLLEEWRNAKK